MIKLSPSRLACALFAVAAWLPLHAHAGLLDDDEARKAILDLRAKVDNLSRDLNARLDSKSDKTAALDMLNVNEQTNQEIARLRGQVEVLANEIATSQKRQRDYYADLDARIKKLEPRQETIDGQAAEVLPNEKQAYDAAYQQFTAGQYEAAVTSLQQFVRRYPDSPYASNAQYWLGNAYFTQRDCKNAIAAQQVVVNTYPTSAKAPDAMLNIASCYIDQKDKVKARTTLQSLIKKYPDSASAATAKDRLAALK
jgi:tol-pal system protein YbgF